MTRAILEYASGGSRNTATTAKFQVWLDYTANQGSIHIDAIYGYRPGQYNDWYHDLPVGNATIQIGNNTPVTVYVTHGNRTVHDHPPDPGGVVGYGFSSIGYKWVLDGSYDIPGSGTDTIKLTVNVGRPGSSGNYFIGAVFTATVTVPPAHTVTPPNIEIGVSSSNVNNVGVSYSSSTLVDLSSYSFTFRLYSDAGRTQQVWSFSGSNITGFPYNWNSAVPGTTYYWSFDCSGVDSVTGETTYMPQKTGSVTTVSPWVNDETFTFTASPLANGHWTPRTVVSYSISNHASSDHAAGLSFVGFQIQTALNGLQNDTKDHEISGYSGTISLTDTTKLLREAKPRDLVYIKCRVICQDNAGRRYYSGWFGILTAQYIYNWYHIYLTTPTINNALRVNSRIQFSGQNQEKYWNKGGLS